MRVLLQFVVCSMLIALASCGGDSGDPERVLDLTFGQMTEGELRETLQEEVGGSAIDELQCTALARISGDEAVEALDLSKGSESFNADDERRLVELYREACEGAYDWRARLCGG